MWRKGRVSIILHQLLQLLAYLGGGGGRVESLLLCISCSSCWPTWVVLEEGQSLSYSASAAQAVGLPGWRWRRSRVSITLHQLLQLLVVIFLWWCRISCWSKACSLLNILKNGAITIQYIALHCRLNDAMRVNTVNYTVVFNPGRDKPMSYLSFKYHWLPVKKV
jgi:hypothetical protein